MVRDLPLVYFHSPNTRSTGPLILLDGLGADFELRVLDRGADELFAAVSTQLEAGPWLLGERFLDLDMLWGTAMSWITGFGLLEPTPAISAYIERTGARPAWQKVRGEDAERAGG